MNCFIKKYFKDDICRLCALENESLIPIFNGNCSEIHVKLKTLLPSLEINQGDTKPQHVCNNCMVKLNMCSDFMQGCIEADCKLSNYIQQCQEEEDNLLKAAMTNSCNVNVWPDDVQKAEGSLESGSGVIVLSNMEASVNDTSVQDFVVMIELKYKDNLSLPDLSRMSTAGECSVAKQTSPMTEALNKDQVPISVIDPVLGYQDNMEGSQNKMFPKQIMHIPGEIGQKVITDRATETCSSVNLGISLKKKYECQICKRQFGRRTRLNAHMSSHTDLRPHQCPTCGKAFAMRWDLNLHLRIHARTFACPICDKAFCTKAKLDRHSKVHSGERPFTCAECGKGFGEKRNLDNHARTHSGERPYTCQLCCKTFSVQSHMVDHLKVHNKTPRYECNCCGKKFKWKNNYNRHLKTHKLV